VSRLRALLLFWGRFGGGARYTIELARALAGRRELEVHLSFSAQAEMAEEMRALGLPSHAVSTYSGRLSALAASARLARVRRELVDYVARAGIDVVLCTMTHSWTPFVGPAVRQAGARYLVTAHDAALHPGEESRLRQRLIWRELASADGVIALSDWVASRLRVRPGIADERLRVASLGGLGLRRPDEPRRHPGERGFQVLFFGRILPYKNLGALLDAYASLRAEHPSLSLHVAGPGSLAPHAARLRELSVAVTNRWIPEAAVADVLAGADLLVAPYVEASQSAALAMAARLGVPCVATPVGGLPEQVRELAAGIVAEGSDAASVARAVQQLIVDAALYDRCARAVHERAAREAERFAESHVRAIRELTARPACGT
jgi:glycosyltransferase involved in cell wall biosynthesis